VVLRSDYNEAVQGYAAAGLGVALMPRLAVNLEDERTVAIGLGELVPPRRIAIAWHADRVPSEAANALTAIAVEAGAGLEEPARSVAQPFF
jgi:DNA-binding transcriptional LysR family regulator